MAEKKLEETVSDNKYGLMAGIGGIVALLAAGAGPILAIIGGILLALIGSFAGDQKDGAFFRAGGAVAVQSAGAERRIRKRKSETERNNSNRTV